ncbi:MAG: energy transducer TonB [Myxococcales bacterium]|nr:energy transducer TonB [Myxococcales bacterium]
MTPRSLEIVAVFRDTVLDVFHLADGETFTLGGPGARLAHEHPALPPDAPHAIARLAGGVARVEVPAGVEAAVLSDGNVAAIGTAGGFRLLPGHRARIVLGDLTLIFALVDPAAAPRRGGMGLLDTPSRRGFAAAIALHAAFLLVAFSMPVDASEMSLDRLDLAERFVVFETRPLTERPEAHPAITLPPLPKPPSSGSPDAPEKHLAQQSPGAEGKTPKASDREGAKQVAQETADAVKVALESELRNAFGPGDSDRLTTALENLNGDPHGDPAGLKPAGPGLNGPGGPGGFDHGPSLGVNYTTHRPRPGSKFGPTTDVPERTTRAPKMPIQKPAEVIGGMDKEEIARAIRQHRNEFRYCYEKQLQSDRDLAGKVMVKFVIGPDGAVQVAQVLESTLGAPAVDECLRTRLTRVQFPPVQGGGYVVVRYPFLFKAN